MKSISCLVYVCVCYLSQVSLLWASQVADKPVSQDIVQAPATIEAFSFMSVLNMMLGLLVVIALILGLAWVLKKYAHLPNQNLVDMKILGGLSLGTRERAVLIEVDNTRLLVGVSPGHIQTLYVLGTATDHPADTESQTTPPGSTSAFPLSGFHKTLQQLKKSQ